MLHGMPFISRLSRFLHPACLLPPAAVSSPVSLACPTGHAGGPRPGDAQTSPRPGESEREHASAALALPCFALCSQVRLERHLAVRTQAASAGTHWLIHQCLQQEPSSEAPLWPLASSSSACSGLLGAHTEVKVISWHWPEDPANWACVFITAL